VIVWSDGAARGNPGPAGAGALVTDADGGVLAEIAEGLGVATNNVAEYTAAILGLERAAELGAADVLLRSDSRLLIEQLGVRDDLDLRHGELDGLREPGDEAPVLGDVVRRDADPLAVRGENRAVLRLEDEGERRWAGVPAGAAVGEEACLHRRSKMS